MNHPLIFFLLCAMVALATCTLLTIGRPTIVAMASASAGAAKEKHQEVPQSPDKDTTTQATKAASKPTGPLLLQGQKYPEFSPKIVKELVGDKRVSIKIGVLNLAKLANDNTFWFEFDPTVAMTVTPNRWLLPYAASTETHDSVPFYIHKLGGCSSMYPPSGAADAAHKTEYLKAARGYCDHFAKTHDKSEWKLWDQRAPNFDKLMGGSYACFMCQDPSLIKKTIHFPSLAMRDVVRNIPYNVTLFDIDAQGADVEILKSIGPALKRVSKIKLECQDLDPISDSAQPLPPIYATTVPNSCSDGVSYLQTLGFELEHREINNCACSEYNMILTNKHPVVVED